MKLNSTIIRIVSTVIFNLLLISCNFAQNKTEKEDTEISTYSNSKVFFKAFDGNLSKGRNIKLLLSKNANSNETDNLITCLINDESEKQSEIFEGEINDKGFFNIKSNEDEEIIILKGQFISDSKIIIDYLDSQRQRFLKIKLDESKSDFSIFPMHYENSKIVNNEECDSITNTIEVDILSVKSKDINLSEKINHTIEKSIYIDDKYSDIEDYIKKEDLTYASLTNKLDVLSFDNNFLILINSSGYKICHAPHGEYNSTYLNINLRSGQKVKLEDILLNKTKNKLFAILQQKLKKINNEFVLGNNEKLDIEDNFALLKKGILFSYNQDELESFSEGTEILVPYSEIYGILNTESEIFKSIIGK